MIVQTIDFLKKHRKGDEGFSLLELVVAVGVLLVLTVGGLLAYNGITNNARQAAVNNAADTVYNRAMVYETDNLPGTTFQTAVDDWNKASGILPDGAAVANIVAGIGVNEEKIIVEGTELENSAFEIKATYGEYFAIKESLAITSQADNTSLTYTWDHDKNRVEGDGYNVKLFAISNGLANNLTDEYNLKITLNFNNSTNISDVSSNFTIVDQSSDNRTYVLENKNPSDNEMLSFTINTSSYGFYATMHSDNTKVSTTTSRTAHFAADIM